MEGELDAVLIDAFDAEPAPEDAMPPMHNHVQTFDALRVYGSPVMKRTEAAKTSAPVVALRHYPSLDALSTPAARTTPPPRPVITRENKAPVHRAPASSASVQYPRLQSTSVDAMLLNPPVDQEKPSANSHPPPLSTHQKAHHENYGGGLEQHVQTTGEPEKPIRTSPPRRSEVPTDEEIAHQQRLLQDEVALFQQRADYMALALAGETPHQIETRRQREEERKEREERRLAAMDTRVLNAIEREQQREERAMERRKRHAERTHRSSVSPSPEREDQLEDGEATSPPPFESLSGSNEA